MRKRGIVWLIALLLVLAGCGAKEELPPAVESGGESAAGEPEPPPPEAPAPFTRFAVDDYGYEYPVVESRVEQLFALPAGTGGDSTLLYLLGENLALYRQQEEVVILDLAGAELGRVPCRGAGVSFSGGHMAVVRYEAGEVAIHDARGEQVGAFAVGDLPGTVQTVAVSPDGLRAVFTADSEDGSGYDGYLARLDTGAVTRLDLSGKPEAVRLGHLLTYPVAQGLVAFQGERENGLYQGDAAVVYVDPDTGQVVETVIQEASDLGYGLVLMPWVLTTRSGLVYTLADANQLRLGFPQVWEESLYSAGPSETMGAAYRYDPVTGEGKVGYFPRYAFRFVGMEAEDSALISYFDAGAYYVARVILTSSPTRRLDNGLDFSRSALDTLLGQELLHHGQAGRDAYHVVSAAVTRYTDLFAESGYRLDGGSPGLEDQLLFYTMLYAHRYDPALGAYRAGEEAYDIPLEVAEEWIREIFPLEGVTLELSRSSWYRDGSIRFEEGPMGIGERDTVYLESAEYAGGVLELVAVVLPGPYRAASQGDAPERVRMELQLLDDMGERVAYRAVEVLS